MSTEQQATEQQAAEVQAEEPKARKGSIKHTVIGTSHKYSFIGATDTALIALEDLSAVIIDEGDRTGYVFLRNQPDQPFRVSRTTAKRLLKAMTSAAEETRRDLTEEH